MRMQSNLGVYDFCSVIYSFCYLKKDQRIFASMVRVRRFVGAHIFSDSLEWLSVLILLLVDAMIWLVIKLDNELDSFPLR